MMVKQSEEYNFLSILGLVCTNSTFNDAIGCEVSLQDEASHHPRKLRLTTLGALGLLEATVLRGEVSCCGGYR